MISRRYIRQKIKRICNGHVEQETIVFMQMGIEAIFEKVCKEARKDFDEINQLRKEANLPVLRRIPSSQYKKQLERLLNEKTIKEIEKSMEELIETHAFQKATNEVNIYV